MEKDDNEATQNFPCYECPAGVMRPRPVTYFTWLNGELITVPHFPAWVCDVCGRREYDEKAIAWLSMILSPDAGKPTLRTRKRPFARPRNDSIRPTTER